MVAPSLDRLRSTFTEESIRGLVYDFYGQVRNHPELGPIFERRISDWPAHLERMVLFWKGILRAEAGYRPVKGPPPLLHRRIEELTHEHFDQWLTLFRSCAEERFDSWAARNVMDRASRIAVALSAHLPTRESKPPHTPASTKP